MFHNFINNIAYFCFSRIAKAREQVKPISRPSPKLRFSSSASSSGTTKDSTSPSNPVKLKSAFKTRSLCQSARVHFEHPLKTIASVVIFNVNTPMVPWGLGSNCPTKRGFVATKTSDGRTFQVRYDGFYQEPRKLGIYGLDGEISSGEIVRCPYCVANANFGYQDTTMDDMADLLELMDDKMYFREARKQERALRCEDHFVPVEE
jgi:hypothetical protein